MSPRLLITIDTECDNGWARQREIKTENARYLPRFQALCESHGFKPTYLVNYEMALSEPFRAMAREALDRSTAEVGMHLHAWHSPPFGQLTKDDYKHHPFLIEFPQSVMREKITHMTELLTEVFGRPPTSHRAGRWALDERYARLLVEHGYRVDCSVTPHVDWSQTLGDPNGSGGPDYRAFPDGAYFVDLDDISRPGSSPLLELPTTVEARTVPRLVRQLRGVRRLPTLARRTLDYLYPERLALVPGRRNDQRMMGLVERMLARGHEYVELSFHSPELMPGGSPSFPDFQSIEDLYRGLARFFDGCRVLGLEGATLREYADLVDSGKKSALRSSRTGLAS